MIGIAQNMKRRQYSVTEYLCQKGSRIYFVCRNHNATFSSFMTSPGLYP